MATTGEFAQYILDCLDSSGARVKKMFGEYTLYYDDKVVGLICDNKIFLKITENCNKVLETEKVKLKRGQAYPGSKDYYVASEEVLENRKLLHKIIFGIMKDVEVKKKKKK